MQSAFKRTQFLLLAVTLNLALSGCGEKKSDAAAQHEAKSETQARKPAAGKAVIAMLPKLINIDYFDACKRGAAQSAEQDAKTLIMANSIRFTKENIDKYDFGI